MHHWLSHRAADWMSHDIIERGRLPLLVFFLGLIVGFVVIRISVRLIRADVGWWFSNVTAGDTHVHHVVFGVVLTLLSGLGLIAFALSGDQAAMSVLAGLFGVGAALILDEFALIFYLRDVYWSQEGRTSVDAVFIALAATGMILLGFRPLDLYFDALHDLRIGRTFVVDLIAAVLNLVLAAIVVLKGKVWTGVIGVFAWPLLIVGVIRLARPTSPWARWRYLSRPRKLERAIERERKLRRPFVRVKIFVQDLVAGRPDVLPHVRVATEDRLDRVVHPAPPPPAISPQRGLSGTIVGLPGDDVPPAGRGPGTHLDSEHEPVEPHT
ncbi:hypothetical protein [Gordonia hankookensis]|uniref:Integral membrane protein n=1 Tax=Gordonia hankookensis TaxID=589403 RepID=A0ABR7WIR0_9ACTN|nr:hypothetical protein [Gordonia hankookensis]MBD1321672.1 hypothetical protein [Gordonia hankookensis]NDZ93269.1 hypothetical protein [Streptomyces sp. SID11726]NDZ94866.1 hypothetical protein [Streptomyces sp. SID11726]NEB23026.1 hypothetical protein [Streptomyces sp. SID6673]